MPSLEGCKCCCRLLFLIGRWTISGSLSILSSELSLSTNISSTCNLLQLTLWLVKSFQLLCRVFNCNFSQNAYLSFTALIVASYCASLSSVIGFQSVILNPLSCLSLLIIVWISCDAKWTSLREWMHSIYFQLRGLK